MTDLSKLSCSELIQQSASMRGQSFREIASVRSCPAAVRPDPREGWPPGNPLDHHLRGQRWILFMRKRIK